MTLTVGIAQHLGAAVENALLHQAAQAHEKSWPSCCARWWAPRRRSASAFARELHDATGQGLTAVALGLRGVESLVSRGSVNNADLVGQLQELQSFSNGALRELREIIADLRPPQLDDLGLVAAMRWYIQAYERRRGITGVFAAEGDEGRLPDEYKTVLFRIMQESLTNIGQTCRRDSSGGASRHTAHEGGPDRARQRARLRPCGAGCGERRRRPAGGWWGSTNVRYSWAGALTSRPRRVRARRVRVCVPLGPANTAADEEEME